MQYFTLQAGSLKEAIDKMKKQYGAKARILTHRDIRMGGFMGMFAKEGIEITGYLSHEQPVKRDLEGEKKKILESVKKEQTMGLILKELQSLKESIKNTPDMVESKENPTITKIEELLRLNDFSYDFIKRAVAFVKSRFSLDDMSDLNLVQKAVIDWIGEQVNIYSALNLAKQKPMVFIIVGPTGVGKTTTIAKLAAIYGIGDQRQLPLKVRMITIDNYRIAAKKQIETYAEIMQIPVSFAESYSDLEKAVALNQDVDLILIDTIGKSPSDYDKLSEMKKILSACGTFCETHLAISATTKSSDVEEVLQQFEPFNYKSVILTKLDETTRIGNILSVLARKNKPVSYITDGQVVPQDIERASVVRLLMKLEGVRLDREFLEEKFSKKEKTLTNNWR